MTESDHQVEAFATFWNFLAYLQKIVDVAKEITKADTDPGRTRLLSTLTEYMCHVLSADLTFVGYRSEEDPIDWLRIDKDSVRPKSGPHWQSPLVRRLEGVNWCFPRAPFKTIQVGTPVVYFDKRLDDLPELFRDVVTALAVSRVILLEREYFLFFCDIEEDADESPRYTDFDKTMLSAAVGLLEVGFQSGARGGRELEDKQARQFLSGLADELNKPVRAVLENADKLQSALSADCSELCETATRALDAAYQLDLLVDTIRLSFSEEEPFDEALVVENIERPLREAIDVYAGEARAKGVQIRGPYTFDEQPFPKLPLYPSHLTVAFKNLIRNAIDYSLDDTGQYSPIEILGHSLGNEFYAIDITSYGIEITEDELEQDLLFKPKYRGEEARQLVSGHLGLGLDAVKRVVKKHEGEVKVFSVPVKPNLYRNTFRVILPIAGPEKKEKPIDHDVFLSYHEDDETTVEALAHRLVKAGIRPWFGKWHLIPGEPWQEATEKAMDACQIFVVFLGASGLGPWANEQMRSALEDRVHDKSRHVVPVLLPGAQKPERKDLPHFLRRVTWVRFESDLDNIEAFRRLLSGIRREAPGPDADQT